MKSTEPQKYFVEQLLAWFKAYQRDLPWRKNKNPYHIWVSEIMLQQTRVDTVIPYFHRFIERFPTIEALASAPEEEVLKLWEGLGYYSRARNLQTAVCEVKEKYNSRVPDNKDQISKLRGVGPYTAGAILSIAYNKPEPAVDGNVMRVLSRYFLIEEDITKNSTRVAMENLIRELIPHEAAGDFNQALMELGALVCTPRSPHCLTCPVMQHCSGRLEGVEEALPVKKKSKPPRAEERLVSLIQGTGIHKGKILIRQRPQEGLLARLWELPHIELLKNRIEWTGSDEENMDYMRASMSETNPIPVPFTPIDFLMNVEHVFSHIYWDMKVYLCEAIDDDNEIESKNYRWITLEERGRYPFPNVFLRIMLQYEKTLHDNGRGFV